MTAFGQRLPPTPTAAPLFGAPHSHPNPNAPVLPPAIPSPSSPTDDDPIWADDGLTATYDLPGPRTVPPSSLPRRNKVASLRITSLDLSTICIPKLRAAAFLRARFKNPSSALTLLKGTAGLTLDGVFLGTTTLPRVSPGEEITIPLGVDPGVHVSYAEPTVKRGGATGLFSKENATTFRRCITLSNAKPAALDLLVLDQIPVSEDEKLRIEVLKPVGLGKEGDRVRAGAGERDARSGGKEKEKEGKWGSAVAEMKGKGEVAWKVALEGGKGCRLALEWEVKCPAGEVVVSK